jgi:hypothetical protein
LLVFSEQLVFDYTRGLLGRCVWRHGGFLPLPALNCVFLTVYLCNF